LPLLSSGAVFTGADSEHVTMSNSISTTENWVLHILIGPDTVSTIYKRRDSDLYKGIYKWYL